MKDLTTRSAIDEVVSAFYEQAVHDPVIGHFFTQVARLDLESHLPIIGDFWESVLLGSGSYRGNPMLKHLQLAEKSPLRQEHLDRWLELWEQTIRASYAGDKAALAVQRANGIGRLILHKVNQHD